MQAPALAYIINLFDNLRDQPYQNGEEKTRSILQLKKQLLDTEDEFMKALYKRQQLLVKIHELEETLQETPERYQINQRERQRKAGEELRKIQDAIKHHNVRGCYMLTRATLAENAAATEKEQHNLLQNVCNGDDLTTHEQLANLFTLHGAELDSFSSQTFQQTTGSSPGHPPLTLPPVPSISVGESFNGAS